MRLLGLSLIGLLALTGCTSLEGYARHPDTLGYVDGKRRAYFASSDVSSDVNPKESQYNSCSDEACRRRLRDEIVYGRMDIIEFDFDNLERALNGTGNGISLGGDLAVLVANGIGATTGGKQTKAVLNAISGGIVGAQGTINKDLYYQRTLPALLSQMEANRDKVIATIFTGLGKSDAEYPLGAAQLDLRRLVRAGSIPASVGEITQKATDDRHASEQVVELARDATYRDAQVSRDTLRQRVHALTDQQALNLVAQMNRHMGERPPALQDALTKINPTESRFRDPKVARAFLLFWIEHESGAADVTKQWSDELDLAEKG
jgi:hypothetical protein